MDPSDRHGDREASAAHRLEGDREPAARASLLLAEQGRWFSRGRFLLLNSISMAIAWFPFTTVAPGTFAYRVGVWIPLLVVVLFVGWFICATRGGLIQDQLDQAIAESGGEPPLASGDYLRGWWVTAADGAIQLDRDGGTGAILRVHWFLAVLVFIAGAFGVAIVALSRGAVRWAGVPFLAAAVGIAAKLLKPKVLRIRIVGAPVMELSVQHVMVGVVPWWACRRRVDGFSLRPDQTVELRVDGGGVWPLLAAAARTSAPWEARRLAASLRNLGIRELSGDSTVTDRP